MSLRFLLVMCMCTIWLTTLPHAELSPRKQKSWFNKKKSSTEKMSPRGEECPCANLSQFFDVSENGPEHLATLIKNCCLRISDSGQALCVPHQSAVNLVASIMRCIERRTHSVELVITLLKQQELSPSHAQIATILNNLDIALVHQCALHSNHALITWISQQPVMQKLFSQVDNEGCNPLHYASDENCALALMQAGVPVMQGDKDGNSPLHTAVRLGHIPVVTLLLNNNASPAITNRMEETPLHNLGLGGFSAASALVLCNAEVNAKDKSKRTPLHNIIFSRVSAAEKKFTAQLLLNAGANRSMKDIHGATALYLARSHHSMVGAAELIELLKTYQPPHPTHYALVAGHTGHKKKSSKKHRRSSIGPSEKSTQNEITHLTRAQRSQSTPDDINNMWTNDICATSPISKALPPHELLNSY